MQTKLSTVVEKLRETTTFSDTQLVGALQRLATYGMSGAQAMDALSTAAEIAAAKHIDLQTASDALGKAFDGNTMLLRRYGVEVSTISQETTLATEAMKEIGDKIQTATTPQVEAFTAAMTSAGLSVNDATGKLKGHAEIVKELETAWKNGTISADQLSTITATLGLNFEGAKVHAADYAGILEQVNAQYGGTAEAQASTYAGIQERLNNAMTELGEKVGTILLPALSSMAEQLIPVVDGFGKWVAAIAAMPDVKAIIAGVGEGFAETVKEMADVTKAFDDTNAALNQLLTSLGVNLPEGFTALDIVAKVFQGMWMMLVIAPLQETTFILQAFTFAFTEAVNFINGPIKSMTDAIDGFVEWMKTTFQDFYNWLVGGSLWPDLWNEILTIADQKIGQLLTDLDTQLVSPMQAAFAGVMQQVQNFWNTGWQAIQTTFNTTTGQIQADLNTRLDTMIADLRESTSQYAPAAAFALQGMQNAMNAGMALIHGDWQTGLTLMQNALNSYWQAVQSATGTAFTVLEGAFTTGTAAIEGILTDAIGVMEGDWSGFIAFIQQGLGPLSGSLGSAEGSINATVASMESTVASTTSSIQSTLSDTWNAITQGAQNLWSALVGHSLWTDMLATMESQTKDSMANILSTFAGGFGAITPAVPSTGALAAAGLGAPLGQPTTTQQQAITIPITVTLDGQVLTKSVKKVLIEQRQYGARSVGGYT